MLADDDLTLWESHAILAYLGDKTGTLWPTSEGEIALAVQCLLDTSGIAPPIVGDVRDLRGER